MIATRAKKKPRTAKLEPVTSDLLEPAAALGGHASAALGLLQGLAAHVPGLVFQLRLRRNGKLCLPYASEAMREIFRLDPEEVRKDASKLTAMLHPGDVADFLRSIQVSARDLSRWRHEFRVSLEDGRSRWLLGYGVPQRAAGGGVLWHGFIGYSVGGRRGTGKQTKSDFLFAAAHEMRAPVSIMLGIGEMLLNQNPDEARQREFLAIIAGNMARLSSIIGDLADLARLEARQGEDFVFAPTELGNLLRQVVSTFAAPEGRAAPLLQLGARALVIVADRNQVAQAIAKVLAHAYASSTAQDTVRIELKAQAASKAEGKGKGSPMACIRIMHVGPGGNGEEPERPRERSSRFDLSADLSNMGLGMSAVREIVDFHGGEVLAQRASRRGSGIALLFPQTETAKRAGGRKKARTRGGVLLLPVKAVPPKLVPAKAA